MHELLAVCFWAIDRDSILPDNDGLQSPLARDTMDDAMRATLDRRYVEHDAWSLFAEIMKSAKTFYEWRAEEGTVSVFLFCERGSKLMK
jgi:TBC1 domain family protein 5